MIFHSSASTQWKYFDQLRWRILKLQQMNKRRQTLLFCASAQTEKNKMKTKVTFTCPGCITSITTNIQRHINSCFLYQRWQTNILSRNAPHNSTTSSTSINDIDPMLSVFSKTVMSQQSQQTDGVRIASQTPATDGGHTNIFFVDTKQLINFINQLHWCCSKCQTRQITEPKIVPHEHYFRLYMCCEKCQTAIHFDSIQPNNERSFNNRVISAFLLGDATMSSINEFACSLA